MSSVTSITVLRCAVSLTVTTTTTMWGEGAGSSLPIPVLASAGLATFVAVAVSAMSITMHFKNYRKPFLQRQVSPFSNLLYLISFIEWSYESCSWSPFTPSHPSSPYSPWKPRFSSTPSVISMRCAYFFEPQQSINLSDHGWHRLGIRYLLLLRSPLDLPRRRAFIAYSPPWTTTKTSSLPPQPLPARD